MSATQQDIPQQYRWLASIAVLAGTFVVVLDSTVVNVSLPHIAGSLSASVEEAAWLDLLHTSRSARRRS